MLKKELEELEKEILFWKKARKLLKKGYGANCKTKDLVDFPEMKQDTSGRCSSCKAKETIDFVSEHIEVLKWGL